MKSKIAAKLGGSVKKIGGANIIAVFSVLISIVVGYKSCQTAEDSRQNTKTALEALDLQRRQVIQSITQDSINGVVASRNTRRDSINSLQDSVRNARFIELSERQILVLKDQANALHKGIHDNEFLNRPDLDIEKFGFHFVTDKMDQVSLMFFVENNGSRPAYLKKITLYVMDDKFNIMGEPLIQHLAFRLSQGKSYQAPTPLTINDRVSLYHEVSILPKLYDSYICLILEYTDPYISNKPITTLPISYKWNKLDSQNLVTLGEGIKTYFPFFQCSDTEQIEIAKAVRR